MIRLEKAKKRSQAHPQSQQHSSPIFLLSKSTFPNILSLFLIFSVRLTKAWKVEYFFIFNKEIFSLQSRIWSLFYIQGQPWVPFGSWKNTCGEWHVEYIRVPINFSKLYCAKLYNKNLLFLAAPEGPLWFSLIGRKFCNFACCRLLKKHDFPCKSLRYLEVTKQSTFKNEKCFSNKKHFIQTIKIICQNHRI